MDDGRTKKVWDTQKQAHVDMPTAMQAFLNDLEALCRRHSLCIGHEDPQGSFDVRALTEENLHWLISANKNYPQED